MKTVVFTSDNHNWLLRGFLHQYKKYVDEINAPELKIEVAGFTKPDFLPDDVSFFSIGKMQDYPVNKWSDGIIAYLKQLNDPLVLILLEDYWLIRKANIEAIYDAARVMQIDQNVFRFDLSTDRLFSKDTQYYASYNNIDICAGKGAYALSFQAGIFRTDLLLEFLEPGETPWQSELEGTWRVDKSRYTVFGSYQWPLNYAIVVNKGKFDRTGSWMYPARTLSELDWQELDKLGYTEKEQG